MNNIKRVHPASFKAKVALEVIKEIESITQVCSRYSIHPTQAKQWKQQLLANVENIYSGKPSQTIKAKDEMIDELYKQIGQLKVELDWLKKKLSVWPKLQIKINWPFKFKYSHNQAVRTARSPSL